jgi:hypothetical protein
LVGRLQSGSPKATVLSALDNRFFCPWASPASKDPAGPGQTAVSLYISIQMGDRVVKRAKVAVWQKPFRVAAGCKQPTAPCSSQCRRPWSSKPVHASADRSLRSSRTEARGLALSTEVPRARLRRSASSVLTPRRNAVPARPICTSLTEVTVRWAEARRRTAFRPKPVCGDSSILCASPPKRDGARMTFPCCAETPSGVV